MKADLTKGSERKLILSFSLPIILSQILQVSYTMADSIIVGNYVGPSALGAVSVSGPIIWIASAAAMGLGTGTNILLAQYFGAKKEEKIRQALISIVAFSFLISFAFIGLILWTHKEVLTLVLDVPSEMYEDARNYLVIYSFGIVFQILFQIFYGACRSFGDANGSLIFLIVAAVMNLLLDLVLVPGMEMGVCGAAYASVASQVAACVSAFLYLKRNFTSAFPDTGEPFLYPRELIPFLRFSLPISGQLMVQASGYLFLQRMVNSFGPASIEGFATMDKTECFIHIPALSVASAIASFVGQNMGAGEHRRAEIGIRFSLRFTVLISFAIGFLMFVFAEPILRIYNISGDALLRGSEHLRIMCVLLPVYTVQQIINGALQGAGDVNIPVLSTFTDLILRLSFTAIMAPTFIGFRSIYLSSIPAWLVACAISVIRYRRGDWKKKAI